MNMTFVIATDDEEKAKAAIESIRKIRGPADQIVLIENSDSMAKAYNEGVERAEFDRICFMHHDVELRPSTYWSDEMLDALYKRYRIGFLGAAGSKDLFPDARWYIDGNRMCGAVIHGQFYKDGQPNIPQQAKKLPDGRMYAEWLTSYGDFGRCVVMDGVVLITTKEVLADIGGFDEITYPDCWHYYDMDVTLRAHLNGYHNIAVPLFLRHLSLGSYNDQWAQTKDKFVEKWEGIFPVTVLHHEDYTIEHLRNLQVAGQ